jgi:hypothetical protein
MKFDRPDAPWNRMFLIKLEQYSRFAAPSMRWNARGSKARRAIARGLDLQQRCFVGTELKFKEPGKQ